MLLLKVTKRANILNFENWLFYNVVLNQSWLHISTTEKHVGIIIYKHFWLDKSFNGTFMNQVLISFHGGSIETTRTVPLTIQKAGKQKCSEFKS